MSAIFGANQIKAWDAYTIKNTPISSLNLMERAAITCSKRLIGSFFFKSITIVCGKGNNGGDGLAIARILAERGYDVSVYICNYSNQESPDFIANLKRIPSTVKCKTLSSASEFNLDTDLIVDCIFGTGLSRSITNWVEDIILKINESDRPIVSIDIPSGLFIEDNVENDLSTVVKASATFSFQSPKMPFFFATYAPYVGRFSILDIGLLTDFKGTSLGNYTQSSEIKLKTISEFAFKGTKGYLTVIAGNENMVGAGLLCTQAAFKTGCGYVGLISHQKAMIPLSIRLPEAIYLGDNPDQLPGKTSAIAIGPGLGTDEKSIQLLQTAFKSQHPLVIDADAINLISAHNELLNAVPKGSILTPHLGELHRLIGTTNRPEELLEKQKVFSKKHGVYIIQKGAYSKLTSPEGALYINSTGNPAMATAGMGDALTGIIGSFLAQGYSPLESAINGMYFHGLAGDYATNRKGKIGLLTSDLIEAIPSVLNGN